MKPRLLDLFCGAGGCAVGYSRAGFEVVGVDSAPMSRFPFEFHQADALEYLAEHGHEFDVIHASPPCQRYSCASRRSGTAHKHPDLLGPTRDALKAVGKTYVIENVPGAPMRHDIILCGTLFGLQVMRHRWFEISPRIFFLVRQCRHIGKFYSVFGHGAGNKKGVKRNDSGTVAEWKVAMGIDWMSRAELSQAIPPAYTQFIGEQLIERLHHAATARPGTPAAPQGSSLFIPSRSLSGVGNVSTRQSLNTKE